MATRIDEQSMDETTTTKQVEDTMDATTFDLAAWVEGVQPVTHTVTLYARGDLVGDLDLIQSRLRLAKASRDYEEVKRLQDKAKPIIDALNASALDVVVVGWSQDRIDGFRKDLADQGVEETRISMEQVAAQVISPEGLDADMLETLFDRIGPQAQQIVGAVSTANATAPTVTVPF